MSTIGAVGILSPGEMGSGVGEVLHQRGLRVLTCLAGRGPGSRERAARAGLEDARDLEDLVRVCDMLLSIVPPAVAGAVADQVAAAVRATGASLLYADCNAIAPRTARDIARTVTEAGARFADGGIIGPPPTTPGNRIFTSGPGAREFAGLGGFGLDIRVLEGEVGQASGLKMCYAALTKGLSALGAELLISAEKMDLLDPLLAELRDSQATVLDWLERSVPGMPPKARRWVSEMEEIAATFAHEGQSPGYHRAASELYRRVGQTALGQERPESRDTTRTLRAVIEELATADAPPLLR
jgi:3-hydroxyisobutyrate dehydrogenase-like beta-hydroxyacid dehydrogenase